MHNRSFPPKNPCDRSKKRQRNGFALLLSLIVMMILFLLATAYLGAVLSESGITRNQENGEKAFYYAEAGINRGVRHLLDDPSLDNLPWTVTENLTDGYYELTCSQAADVGTEYVRVLSTGYCGNASRQTEVMILLNAWTKALMSDTDIDFQDSTNAYIEGDVHANGTIHNGGAAGGLDYVPGSRNSQNDDLTFEVKNNTGAAVTLTAFTAVWTAPVAYYEQIDMRVVGGTNYGAVWKDNQAGGVRRASGQRADFNQGNTVILPPDENMSITLLNFRANQTGNGGAAQNMNNTTFTITNWAGTNNFQTGIPLEGQGASVEITGTITQGSMGDPAIKMPKVLLDRFYEDRTFYYNGDYIFNGIEGQSDTYRDESFYITGTVTLDSSFRNLTFNYCALVALGGVRIGPQRNGTLDFMLDSTVGKKKDISFEAENKTSAALTLTALSLLWNGDNNNRYQQINVEVVGGTNYGTVWSGNASKNTVVTLSPAVSIPAQASILVSLTFSRNTDYSLLITAYQSATPYTFTMVEEGRIPNLYFRGRREYSAMVTQTGDILEYGTKVKEDMLLQGIIYSEQGTVEFNNLTLDGAILGNKINLLNDIDIQYTPRYVPNPPPEFISGYTFVDWKENY